MPKNKLIINERQLTLIAKLVKESNSISSGIVRRVVNYLDEYYEPTFETYQTEGEYYNQPMIKNKVDEEMIAPKNLLRHLKEKFNKYNPEFLGQVIRDWYDGKLREGNYIMSKNVPPTM